MAYDISALPNYTEQPEKVIFEKLFTTSPILEAIKSSANLMTGVKSTQTINFVNTEGVWQAQGCSFNASGGTTFTQREVSVGKPKIDLEWCEKDLEPKFTQKAMVKGSEYTSLTYNTEIVDDVLQKSAKRQATAIWQGDTTSGNAYLNKYDGLIKIIDAATIGGTYSGTAWSEANSRTVMKGLAALVIADEDVYKGGDTEIKFYCSPAVRTAYAWKLIADNAYHIDPKDGTQKLYVEGTTIEIVADIGLTGTNYIYAIEDMNLHGATDMENEQEKIEMWYSQDDRKLKLNIEWKFGINVAFPSRIYKYLGV
jgi:hypothetical protein